MTETPYLSVVATARNDNHGGDLLYRMQLFVNGLVAQCERHALDAELILVEWNPPGDRPPLADVLDWPESDRCAVRIIEVPHDFHAQLEYADRLPLFQMIAKNVGIRRARGEFVLATNVDVLLSDELVEFIAARKLEPGGLYRTDRYDVTADIPADAPVEEQLRLASERIIRICSREGTLDLRTGAFYRIYNELSRLPWWLSFLVHVYWFIRRRVPDLGLRAARTISTLWWGLLALGADLGADLARLLARVVEQLSLARQAIQRTRGVPPQKWRARDILPAIRAVLQDRSARAASSHHEAQRPFPTRLGAHLRLVADGYRARGRYYRTRISQFRAAWHWERAHVRLHTNASGDFTLLSAADWNALRGYAELQLFSMHIDGLFLYQAHYAGMQERFLPHRVYHLEHSAGFKPDDEGLRALNDRLGKASIPQITNEQFMEWAIQMYEDKRAIQFNDSRWGLADAKLAETTPAQRVVAAS